MPRAKTAPRRYIFHGPGRAPDAAPEPARGIHAIIRSRRRRDALKRAPPEIWRNYRLSENARIARFRSRSASKPSAPLSPPRVHDDSLPGGPDCSVGEIDISYDLLPPIDSDHSALFPADLGHPVQTGDSGERQDDEGRASFLDDEEDGWPQSPSSW